MGLSLQPPNVNYAGSEFSVRIINQSPVLLVGLNQVRELTQRTLARIIQNQPFHSFQDFLARTDPRPNEANNLARCGALEDFGTIPGMLKRLEQPSWKGGQLSLFELESSSEQDWSLEQKAVAQEEILGVSVIAHPLELNAKRITALDAISTVEAAAQLGKRVRVAGMRQTWRRSRTRRGDYVYFLALEDLEGMLDVIIYSDVYRRYRSELSGPGPYVVEGLVELDQEKGEPFIRAERLYSG